jgi:ribonuclease P protein component
MPNQQPRWRLGLSVGKRVGNAVARNRAKRLVREAFRLSRHELEGGGGSARGGFDIVVSVRGAAGGAAAGGKRPGAGALTLEDVQAHLVDAARKIVKEWERRDGRAARGSARDGTDAGHEEPERGG